MTDAITREEKLLAGVAIEPITREEMFLAKLAGQNVNTPEPITRKEKLIQRIIDNGISGGGSDNTLDYATFSNGAVFKGAVFPENYVLNIKLNSSKEPAQFQQTFMNTQNVDVINIHLSDEITLGGCANAFSYSTCKEINITGSVVKPINLGGCFSTCLNLEKINALFDLSACTNVSYAFVQTGKLKEITVVANTIKMSLNFDRSPLLTDETIQNIIDGLATVETAQTLTLHADVKAKLTETQIATITSKNWTLA